MTNKDGASKQALPQPSFRLTWRDGTYRVSRPNVGETDCYTADQMREYGRLCAATPASPAVGGVLTDERIEAAFNEKDAVGNWVAGGCTMAGFKRAVRWTEARLATLSAPVAPAPEVAPVRAVEQQPVAIVRHVDVPFMEGKRASAFLLDETLPDGTSLYLATPAQATQGGEPDALKQVLILKVAATLNRAGETPADALRMAEEAVEAAAVAIQGGAEPFRSAVATSWCRGFPALAADLINHLQHKLAAAVEPAQAAPAAVVPARKLSKDTEADLWNTANEMPFSIWKFGLRAAIDRLAAPEASAAKPTGKEQSS